MAGFNKVRQVDIALGKPLSHSVYDKDGMLLLKAGCTINLRRQLDFLLESGLFMKSNDESAPQYVAQQPVVSEAQNAFETLDRLKIQLKNIFGHFKSGKAHENFIRSIMGISLQMQEACTHDTDAALANLHLDYETPYIVVHSLQAAMICELVGKKLDVPESKRLTSINAALTQSIGLLDIHDALDRQSQLTTEQRARIAAHPIDGVALLRELGVNDSSWLDAVQQHHERIDGSGYPHKLTGDNIEIPARLLAVADTYSAMVRERPYRKAMLSKEAMRSLLVERGEKIDQRLVEMMIKVLGIFPPGAIVKLANGEVGVVKKRQENSTYPIVFSFVSPDGMPRLSPVQRDTGNKEFGIEGIVNFSTYKNCIAVIRGLWLNN